MTERLPKPCHQCGWPDSYSASQFVRREQEATQKWQELRDHLAAVMAAGGGSQEVAREALFHLDLTGGDLDHAAYRMRMPEPRVNREWSLNGLDRGNSHR